MKKKHKLEMEKINNVLSSNTEEFFCLWNHNKTLITKNKKLKHDSKREHSSEDLQGRILEKHDENQCQKNIIQELEKQIKKLENDKKLQDERFEKIESHNNPLEKKVVQIQEDMSRNQVKEVKAYLAIVQKKEKQTTHMPYRHPNYNHHFDQR